MTEAPSSPSAMLNRADFESNTSSSSLILRSRASARSLSEIFSAMPDPPHFSCAILEFERLYSRRGNDAICKFAVWWSGTDDRDNGLPIGKNLDAGQNTRWTM